MNAVPLTWAVDADLIITIAIVLFGIVIPLILNVINKLKEVGEKVGGGARPARPRPADPNVEDEIGEFLRRAAGRRQGPQGPPPVPEATRRLVPQEPVEAVVLEPAPIRPALAEQVAHDVDTRKFDERSRQLQRRAAEASRKAQQQVKKKFDHAVGRLVEAPAALGAPASAGTMTSGPEVRLAQAGLGLAAGLPALLRNTDNLRQAIVINEILQRPEQRWSSSLRG